MSEPTLVIRLAHTAVDRSTTIFFKNKEGIIERCNLRSYLAVIDRLEGAMRELKSALANKGQNFLGVEYGTETCRFGKGEIGRDIANELRWVCETFGYVWPLNNHDLAQGKSPCAVYPTINTKTVDMIRNIGVALKTLHEALYNATTENDADEKDLIIGINAHNGRERRYWNNSYQCFMEDMCVTNYEV